MRIVESRRHSSRQSRYDIAHVADYAEIKPATAAQILAANVDLRDLGLGRIELPIREISAEHEQGIATLHGVISGGKPDEPRHPHIVGIVPFDVLLATHRMHDGRFEFGCEGYHGIVGACTTGPTEDHRPF